MYSLTYKEMGGENILNYTANDLTTLSPGKAFRTKLGMYLSADKQEAINLGLRELIYNAQDEYEATHQKNAYVKITIMNDEIMVEDNMRGIPVGMREDGQNSLTAAFLIPHSGAKHKEGVYLNAVGVNGQGNKIVCHTAKRLKVEVKRDGKIYMQSFHETEEGAVPDNEVVILGETKETGTKIVYIPSETIYNGEKIDIAVLRHTLRELSLFTKGLKLILSIDGKSEEFISQNGLADGLNKENRFHTNFLYFQKDYPDCAVELALQWTKGKGELKPYANNLFVRDGGEFMTGFKTAITRTFNTLANSSFSGEQIRKYLDGYVSVKVKEVQYSNQAKTALANKEARSAMSLAVVDALKDYSSKYPKDFEKIIDMLKREDKAEVAADRARNAILNASKELSDTRKKKVFSSDKLKDAVKLGQTATLILTEGNSAGGTMITARDPNDYGVLFLRGKIISALTNPLDKVLENEEVKLIISALGLSLKNYKSKDLRYGKIAIATDADADGAGITNLIIALFHVLFPEVLKEGRLYKFYSPLYKIERGKKVQYYYSEEELQSAPKALSGGRQQRFKG